MADFDRNFTLLVIIQLGFWIVLMESDNLDSVLWMDFTSDSLYNMTWNVEVAIATKYIFEIMLKILVSTAFRG